MRRFEYIENTPQIRDVLISGGDPLSLSDDRLERILKRLSSIEHVEIIRIGSRMPVVLASIGLWFRFSMADACARGGKHKINCPYKCLATCKASEARYCIAEALLNSYHGDVDHGLIFCGQNAYRINEITTVKKLIDDLLRETKEV